MMRRRFTIHRKRRQRYRRRGCLPTIFALQGWPAVVAGGGMLVAGLVWSIPPLYAALVHGNARADAIPPKLSIGLMVAGILGGVVVQAAITIGDTLT